MNKRILAILAIILILLLIPLIMTPYLLAIGIMVLIFMGLATSLNLIVGYTGQISFAHAAFYGIGAYSSAIISTQFGTSFWLSIVLATIIAGSVGFLLGISCLRLNSHYLAIATIGFQQIVIILMLQWNELTNGPAGITGIQRPRIFSLELTDLGMYYLGLILLGLIILIVFGIMRSKIGIQLVAVREDEISARSTGINISNIKLIAFVISSGLAGASGSFYAHYISTIDPNVFDIMLSATILVMILGGGMGTIAGPLIGAFLLQILPELLRPIEEFRMVAYGLILVLIILFMPEGIVGLIREKLQKIKGKQSNGGENIAS